MAEITKKQDQTIIDYMARDYKSLLDSMYRLVPTKLPEWKDFKSEADFGNVLMQLIAHTADILGYYQDRVANESFLGTAQSRRSVIHHLRLIGYTLSTAAPASAALTLSVPADVTDLVEINRGDAFATKSQKDSPSVRFEYAAKEPMIINWDEVSPDESSGRKQVTVPVEEGRLIKDEVLGESDGSPNQLFVLGQPGLILRSPDAATQVNPDVILLSELGVNAPIEWTLAETLAFSNREQNDFVIDIDDQDRATVRFGDGELGAIPSAGSEIRITYRVGGGQLGNLPADSITTIVDAPQLTLLGAQVTNEEATGGAERETIAHAAEHSPSVFRAHKRAVTADDFQSLAEKSAGVGKVRAEATNWNTVTLYVAPEGGGSVSDILEADLLAYFEDKRPLSTMVEIKNVDWVDVYVTAVVEIEPYYSVADIEEQARANAGGLLAFDEVDFGDTLYLSKVYEEIEKIEGVKGVNVTEFRRDPLPPGEVAQAIAPDGKLVMLSSELARAPKGDDYKTGIKLQTDGGF